MLRKKEEVEKHRVVDESRKRSVEWKGKREREQCETGHVGCEMTCQSHNVREDGEERKRQQGTGKGDREEKASALLKPE